MDYDRKVHLAVDPSLSSVLLANLLADPYLSTSSNPPQRGGRPLNQLVVDNFQQINLEGLLLFSAVTVIWPERTLNRSNLKRKLRYTQSIEIDEKKLCEIKNRLLQKKIAMARLNPSNNEVLKEFLNSIIDGQMTMKHSNN